MRKNWLSTVLVIAYKYKYGGHDEALVGEKMVGLIRILIHTLAAQAHVCDKFTRPVQGLAMRSRDLSQQSLGGETDQNPADNDTVFDAEHDGGPIDLLRDDSDNEVEAEIEGEEERSSHAQKEKETSMKVGGSTLSEAKMLPPGWTVQRLHSGQSLFVDNHNQETTLIDPRTGLSADGKTAEELGLVMESPPSPLSLMDIITVSTPVNVDSVVSESSSSSMVTVTSLNRPLQEERLLPIGPQRPGLAKDEPSREGILDRVWQVFGTMETEGGGENIPLIEEKVTSERIQVVASIQKQDSTTSAEAPTNGAPREVTTECYVGHVTHIRNGSFKMIPDAPPHGSSCAPPSDSYINAAGSGEEASKHETVCAVSTGGAKKKRKRKMGTGTGPDPQTLESSSKTSSICGRASKQGSKISVPQQSRMDSSASLYSSRDNPLMLKQSSLRVGEEAVADRCTRCGMPREEYSEDEIGQCIIILGTFIHQEPSLVAPLLPEILLTVTRIARNTQYSWELDSSTFVPSNSRSIAKQVNSIQLGDEVKLCY